MESPLTMGEAGDSFIEKSKSTEDICLNGDLSNDEPMDISDSKAPRVTQISPKNCSEKVPEDKVPIVTDEDKDDSEVEEAMDVDQSAEEIEDDDEDNGIIKDTEDEEEISAKEDEDEASAKEEEDDEGTVKEDEDDEGTAKEDEDDERSKSADVASIKETANIEDLITDDEVVKESDDEDAKEDEEEDDDDDDDNHDSIGSPSVTPAPPALNGTSTDINGTITLDDDDDKDLNNSDDVVFVQNDSHSKENGDLCSNSDVEEIINISDKESVTPKKSQDGIVNLMSPVKKKVKKTMERLSDPPRRSTRNLHKNKSYVEKDDDPDVEEVTPEDPLADPLRDDKENKKVKSAPTTSTIVVSDTKRLVEIAANSKSSNSTGGKKEPTLVIIDTNSILSGRGPVPVSHKSTPTLPASFSMMPVALPAQGVYPPNMRATITPIPMKQSVAAAPAPAAAPILPTLTDDMYVVEAPSFIVPYVYEKPPIKPFKDFVQKMHLEIEAQKKIIAEEKAKNEAKRKAEQAEKIVESKSTEGESDEDNFKHDEEAKKDAVDKNDKEYKVADDDDEGESDTEQVKQMKESETKEKTINLDEVPDKPTELPKPKSNSYFDNALGQFFINIGYGLVQEFVQTDLLKQTKRKQKTVGTAPETKLAITSLIKNLEYSKENNEPYKLDQKRCEFCSFKTESALVMAHHMETPHMRNYVYKCNFCPLEVRSPHDILFHMEAEHNTRGRLERAPAFHQCPSCSFEDNQKGKLSRHLVTCVKKFKPERNLEPPTDWEPPAKIPRVPRIKQQGLSATAATYQALTQAKGNYQLFTKLQAAASPQAFARGRGRPTLSNIGKINSVRPQTPVIRTNMMYRPSTSGGSVLVPTTYQFGGNQIFQVLGGQSDLGSGRLSGATPVALVPNLAPQQSSVTIQNSTGSKTSTSKVVQQPSISITPLPRQPASSSGSSSTTITKTAGAAGDTSSKATFVICEICDGYIKDLEQLRNHMQWIHKVKIHPKMIYNRPPLNCQKCQFRFFTDQGLERHLLGSHGLVTSSMQEAANKSKDAGRCPVCGRVYQWKLLNHVARDHNMTLKPAHLSYKCTVCTATFGMYKQFENHVYSAHSVVAKRVMDKKGTSTTTASSTATAVATAAAQQRDSLLKPLKINDEITIIPQPAKSKSKSAAVASTSGDRGK